MSNSSLYMDLFCFSLFIGIPFFILCLAYCLGKIYSRFKYYKFLIDNINSVRSRIKVLKIRQNRIDKLKCKLSSKKDLIYSRINDLYKTRDDYMKSVNIDENFIQDFMDGKKMSVEDMTIADNMNNFLIRENDMNKGCLHCLYRLSKVYDISIKNMDVIINSYNELNSYEDTLEKNNFLIWVLSAMFTGMFTK